MFPPYFANRDREILAFRECLQSTLAGHPRHMAVLGDSALGKTSMLLKFRRLAIEKGCLASLGSPYVVDDAESFAHGIIRTLALQIHASYSESVWDRLARALGLQDPAVSALDASLRRHFARTGDAQTALRTYLRIIAEHTRHLAPAILIMVDDVDRFRDAYQAVAVLQRTLIELAGENANVMAILTSGTDRLEAETVTSLEPCFTSMKLDRLSDKAIMDALIGPIAGTPLRLDHKVADRIVELAAGHPYYLQELAYQTFEMADPDYRVTPHTFELALEQTFYRVSVPIFEQRMASLDHGERHLLAVVVHLEASTSLGELADAAAAAGLDDTTVPQLAERLAAKGCIAQVSAPSEEPHYSMPDPLFREYVRRHLDWIP